MTVESDLTEVMASEAPKVSKQEDYEAIADLSDTEVTTWSRNLRVDRFMLNQQVKDQIN